MRICVVIPAYRCKKHILDVIAKIPDFVEKIYLVDDACSEETGKYVLNLKPDGRVVHIFQKINGGVGSAVKAGYLKAIEDSFDVIVKVDGDNQMDLSLMKKLINPLLLKEADYTKGNRFFYPRSISKMPKIRIFGNSTLAFLTKISSGYYSIFDPTNGYTAVHVDTLKTIELEKIHNRYFFESDLLFRLNLSRAKVLDIPMVPIYRDENSNLNELKVIPVFLLGHFKNFYKRILYSYFLRDFTVGSVFLTLGLVLSLFGLTWSSYFWFYSAQTGIPAHTGTIMIGVLTLVLGFQLILSFILSDVSSEPKISLSSILKSDQG